jgi:phosphoglycolate phosphatase
LSESIPGRARGALADRLRGIRGVVFDLDGTLVDSYEAIADSLNHARAAFDLAPVSIDSVRAHVGRGLEALVADLVGEQRVEQAVARFRERYEMVYARMTRSLPAVRETLAELARRGYPMCVASNKPARFGAAIVRQLELACYLVSVQGPDLVGSTKPDPAMLGQCLADLGLEDPRTALYVGDMVLDVETARRAEMPVVLVEGGSSSAAELRSTGQPVISRIDQLLEWLL